MTNPYVIYGGQLSYFTRKLEAACLFYGLEFEMRNKNQSDPANIEVRSGTHQVPVLQTPENWMIGDTTPIAFISLVNTIRVLGVSIKGICQKQLAVL